VEMADGLQFFTNCANIVNRCVKEGVAVVCRSRSFMTR